MAPRNADGIGEDDDDEIWDTVRQQIPSGTVVGMRVGYRGAGIRPRVEVVPDPEWVMEMRRRSPNQVVSCPMRVHQRYRVKDVTDNRNDKRRCKICGQMSIPRRADAVYCKRACRQWACRQRH